MIESMLNIPDEIKLYFEGLYEKALKERERMGLHIPKSQPKILLNVRYSGNLGYFLSESNAIDINIYGPVAKHGLGSFDDLNILLTFVEDKLDSKEIGSLFNTHNREEIERAAGIIQKQDSLVLSDKDRKRMAELIGLVIYSGDGSGRSEETIKRIDSSLKKVDDVIDIRLKTTEYLRNGGHKDDMARIFDLYKSRLILDGSFTEPLDTIRHELDHAAFNDGVLGREFNKFNNIQPSEADWALVRKAMAIKLICEAGGFFFDAIPYDGWNDFRKDPDMYKKRVIESIKSGGIEYILPASYEFIDQQNLYLKGVVDAISRAYLEEPRRLRTAYRKASCTREFMEIARGNPKQN